MPLVTLTLLELALRLTAVSAGTDMPRLTGDWWHRVGPTGYRSLGPPSKETEHAKRLPHPGLDGIAWLQKYLRISREHVLDLAHVAPATFYYWRANPGASVRPKTVSHLLRVVASLRLLIARYGDEDALSLLKLGSPTLLEQLSGPPAQVEEALRRIAEEATPTIIRPSPRLVDSADIVAQLETLSRQAESIGDPTPLADERPIPIELAEELRKDVDE